MSLPSLYVRPALGHKAVLLVDVNQTTREVRKRALEYYAEVKDTDLRQHFAFLVGAPVYVSRKWPNEPVNDNSRSSGRR